MKKVRFSCNTTEPSYICGYEEGLFLGTEDFRKNKMRVIGFPIDNAFNLGLVEGYTAAQHLPSIDEYIEWAERCKN